MCSTTTTYGGGGGGGYGVLHLPPISRPSSHPQFVTFRLRPLRSSIRDVISAEPPALTFYELLGIPATGSQYEIRQAYKQLARKYHPDVSPPDRVEEYTCRFIRVQEAYETLSDPQMRELYDSDMAKGVHLAFTTRRRAKYDEQEEDKSMWKSRWQSQLSELKRRSGQKGSDDNLSWGARIRRERE